MLYIWISYTYRFINWRWLWERGFDSLHNSTKLQTRSNEDAILHKEWYKVDNLYRNIWQGRILDTLNIQLKGSWRTDGWKGKGQRATGLKIEKKGAKNMSNKLGPGKPMKRAGKDWNCSIFERRWTSENNKVSDIQGLCVMFYNTRKSISIK